MTPPRREHEYPPEHPDRPAYFPDVTLGNILAILVFLGTGAGVYAANESRIAKLEVTQDTQSDSVARQILELKQANEKLDAKVERIDDKMDELKNILLQMQGRRK